MGKVHDLHTDETLVARLIRAQMPQWAHLPVREVADGGWDNKSFRLGASMLVRLPRAERYVAQVEKEQTWLPRLARGLPLPIPTPLAAGVPSDLYPWPWSVYAWIDGEAASGASIDDADEFAASLAEFLLALQRLDTAGGPAPGAHNFFRGGQLSAYDGQAREAIERLQPAGKAAEALAIWETALCANWRGPDVWVHGDYAAGNLLVRRGRLAAVIDFGMIAVGDPACDLAIAWTFLSERGRHAFRSTLGLDSGTWARGRGWAIWKAAILVTGLVRGHPRDEASAAGMLDAVIADHRQARLSG